jgi:serine protease AprX
MRRWIATAVASVCVIAASSFSEQISAAPAFDQDEPGTVGEAARPDGAGGKKNILPRKAAVKAPKGISALDEDGDGLADGLADLIAEQGADALVDVIVTFEAPGKGPAWAQNQVGGFSVYSEFDVIPAFAATMRGGQAQALSRANGVFRVEVDGVMSINLKAARDSFGADRLPYHVAFDAAAQAYLSGDLSVAFPTLGGGAGVNVCIIDTGIHAAHEQFEEAGVSRVAGFADFVGDANGMIQSEPYDDHGHGTHVAGITLGDGRSTIDPGFVFEHRGVAPDANIFAAKVLDFEGFGSDSQVIAGIEWCGDQLVGTAGLVNMSLGDPAFSDGQDAVSRAVNGLVALGIPVVVAAGNDGDIPNSVGSPAAASGAITVGAFAEWEADHLYEGYSQGGYIAPFSSRGPTADGRVKPDIVAPGYSIVSAGVDPSGVICQTDCYAILSGTSMAAPFVAGTAALMLEADSTLAPADVKSILTGTAQPWSTTVVPNNESGWGLVDTYAAVQAVDATIIDDSSTATPYLYEGTGFVPSNGFVDIPITLNDPLLPLAITVTIDGQQNVFTEWDPDLDVQLLDENGDPIVVPNPYYPIIGPEFIPLPGTSSTCKAGEECGVAGRQETVHIGPDLTNPDDWYPLDWVLRVNSYTGWPNNGAAGTFTYHISNGYMTGDGPAPDPDTDPPAAPMNLVATAGDGEVSLNWDVNSESDFSSYRVYRATGSSGSYTNIGPSLGTNAYIDNSVTNGTTYYYFVTALDTSDNESDPSVKAWATPTAPGDPLVANAGQYIRVPDTKKEGTETVTLDGSASTGNIDTYEWIIGSETLTGQIVEHTFPVGTTNVTLRVTDFSGSEAVTDDDDLVVEVTAKSGGGGGGGGKGGSGGGGPPGRNK